MSSSLAFSSKCDAASGLLLLLTMGTKILVFILMWVLCFLEMRKFLVCTMFGVVREMWVCV